MDLLENLRKVFRRLNHPSIRSLKLCPRCGSPKLRLSSRLDVWLTPEQYVCEKCGYKGPIVLEIEELTEKHPSKQS